MSIAFKANKLVRDKVPERLAAKKSEVFCMNNRYVMCLDAWTPSDPSIYDSLGEVIAAQR